MNRKVKKLWVEALRSKKYKQGTHTLRNKNKYCCLGVLCDLYLKQKGLTWDKQFDSYYCFDHSVSLPKHIQEWAGLDSDDPKVIEATTLVDCNDDLGLSFNTIAGLIEDLL